MALACWVGALWFWPKQRLLLSRHPLLMPRLLLRPLHLQHLPLPKLHPQKQRPCLCPTRATPAG